MRYLTLLLLLAFGPLAHAQPEPDFDSWLEKVLGRWGTKVSAREILGVTGYTQLKGTPDSLIFLHSKGQDVLVFRWMGDDYTAYLNRPDSSFQLRYNGYDRNWEWACKSNYNMPTALRWQPVSVDSADYFLITAQPNSGYQTLLITTFIGYSLRQERIRLPLKARKSKHVLGYYFYRRYPRGWRALDALAERVATAALNRPVKLVGSGYSPATGGFVEIHKGD